MFRIRLVGQDFLIENRYPLIEGMCRDYLSDGATARRIALSEADYASRDGKFSPDYQEAIAVYRKISEYMLPRGALPFHASALMLDGTAYLFTAPSGTGKSTHASLWRERFGDQVTMINDDKPFLSFEKGLVRAWGTPWCGKEGLQTNISAPVGGIVVLRQAKANEIRPLSREEAFPLLLRRTWMPTDNTQRVQVIALIEELCCLPVFGMGCTVSQGAVEMAYSALHGTAVSRRMESTSILERKRTKETEEYNHG